MIKILALITTILSFSATSFADNSTPELTLQSALSNASKNQTQDFVNLLEDDAQVTYGTPEGVVAFQRAISGLNLQVESATFEAGDNGYKLWSVPVATVDSPNVLVLTAEVECHSNTAPQACVINSFFFN